MDASITAWQHFTHSSVTVKYATKLNLLGHRTGMGSSNRHLRETFSQHTPPKTALNADSGTLMVPAMSLAGVHWVSRIG
jgi:hypothetical protein